MGKRNRWSTRLATLIVACGLLAFASSAVAVRMTAAFPAGSPTQFVVQPGESTTFEVNFTNLDNGPGIAQAWMSSYFLIDLGSAWTIEPLEPAACGYPSRLEGLVVEFPVELEALQTLRCTYRITRGSTSYWDGYLALCPGPQPQSPLSCSGRVLVAFGSLPDIGITTTPITVPESGAGDVVLRIDVSNAGTVATTELELSTQCRKSNGADPTTVLPFQLEVGFPGACPAVAMRGCSPEPPVALFLWQATTPAVPAQGTSSCLVRLRPLQPFTTPIEDFFSLWVGEPYRPVHAVPLLHAGPTPMLGRGFDMNPANNIGSFGIAPVLAVPIASWIAWFLTAMLATLAARRLRREIRDRRSTGTAFAGSGRTVALAHSGRLAPPAPQNP